MKRIYVLQYPDGTFWDGWEDAESDNHECCGGIMKIRSLVIRAVEIEEVTQYA